MGPFLACGVPLVNFLPDRFPIAGVSGVAGPDVAAQQKQGVHTLPLGLSLPDPEA